MQSQFIFPQNGRTMNDEQRAEIVKHLVLAGYTVRLSHVTDGKTKKIAIEFWIDKETKQ